MDSKEQQCISEYTGLDEHILFVKNCSRCAGNVVHSKKSPPVSWEMGVYQKENWVIRAAHVRFVSQSQAAGTGPVDRRSRGEIEKGPISQGCR